MTTGSGSDGSSGFGRGAAAEHAGILLPRRHVGKSSPEFTKLGAPGVKSTRAWVWDDLHGTYNLLAALARLEEACNSERGGGGGSARRNTPVTRARAALGTGTAVNGCVCVRKAKATRNGVSAMLYRATGARPRWSSGGGAPTAAFRPPDRPTGHYN